MSASAGSHSCVSMYTNLPAPIVLSVLARDLKAEHMFRLVGKENTPRSGVIKCISDGDS